LLQSIAERHRPTHKRQAMDNPEEFLQLMMLSLDEPHGARVVQCCVKDHSHFPRSHLHVQVHMRDARGQTLSSEWSLLHCVALDAFKEAADKVGNGKAVRYHMHEDAEPRKTCNKEFLEKLESCTYSLTPDEATTLATEGHDACPVCLIEYESDLSQSVVCMPCDGCHVVHWDCINPWLQEASTCPVCRFELPAEGAAQPDASVDALIGKSVAAVHRLRGAALAAAKASSPSPIRTQSARRLRPQSARGSHTDPDRGGLAPPRLTGECAE